MPLTDETVIAWIKSRKPEQLERLLEKMRQQLDDKLQEAGYVLTTELADMLGRVTEVMEAIKPHRRPRRNEDRDAEIIRLHHSNNSAGQIKIKISDKWEMTESAIRSVIRRYRLCEESRYNPEYDNEQQLFE